MGVIVVNDVMIDIGLALLEPLVNTQLNPTGPAILPGTSVVTPASMVGIYPGALLVVGLNPNPAQEVVQVISTTATTFTATFANPHIQGEPMICMTFPSGQVQTGPAPQSVLFTQAEILGYIQDAQNDFLLKVRPVYAVGTVNLQVGKRIYGAPADSIRVERASIVNAAANPPTAVELYNVAQTDLDLLNYGWQSQNSAVSSWYQDEINTQAIGFGPTPQVGNTVNLFYSQSSPAALALDGNFLIPDPMTIAIKWRVLAVCFSKDGEMRDMKKAAFAQQLYDMIVLISAKFMAGVSGRMKSQEDTVEPVASQRM